MDLCKQFSGLHVHNGTAREDPETREALGTILSVSSIPKLFLLFKKKCFFPSILFKRWVALEGNKETKNSVGSKNSQVWSVEKLGGLVSCLENVLRYVASFVTQAD